jgi:universal stress protein E
MFEFKHILVAISHPAAPPTPALRRAMEIALSTGARVTLFHSLYSPYVASEQFYTPTELRRDIEAGVLVQKAALDVLAKPLIDAGVITHVRCRWDYPVYESIIREVVREHIDLLIADSHHHTAVARLMLSNTDWQLIRLCPCPLLLCKADRSYEQLRALASVDPLHAHAKPEGLDLQLLNYGKSFTTMFAGKLHAAHFYPVAMTIPTGFMGEPLPMPGYVMEDYKRHAQQAFSALVQRPAFAGSDAHCRPGEPTAELPALARELDAHLVVMGAVSRSGLKRLFIGATAERVIDDLTCDVLIIKPEGYKTTVPRRALNRPVMLPPM